MFWKPLASMLLALFCFAVPAMAEQDVFTTDKGEVYPYGNAALTKPHVLVLDGSTVTLNGVTIFPKLKDPSSAPVVIPASSPRDTVYSTGWDMQRAMERTGVGIADITIALAEFYRTQTAHVASVTDVQEGSFWVQWHGETRPEEITVTCSFAPVSQEELARQLFDHFKTLLEHNNLIIIGAHGNTSVNLGNQECLPSVRAEIAHASSLTDVERRSFMELWNGTFIPADIAYEFAKPISLNVEE